MISSGYWKRLRPTRIRRQCFILSSSISGVALGVGLGILLMSTPVGWVTAIILGVGSSLASYGFGKGGAYLYNRYGQQLDLAQISRADQL